MPVCPDTFSLNTSDTRHARFKLWDEILSLGTPPMTAVFGAVQVVAVEAGGRTSVVSKCSCRNVVMDSSHVS